MAAVIALPHWAQAQGAALTLAVNEGVSYRNSENDTRERFQPLAQELSRVLKRTVTVVPVSDYKRLSADLAASRFDLAFVHPAHIAIQAMRSGRYSLSAVTRGYSDYRAHFIVSPASPLRNWQEYLQQPLASRTVIAPAEDSITSVVARATLLETMGALPPVSYTRYQDSVTFSLEHGLAAVGVTGSPEVVKAWQAKGGRVLAVSKPVPIKQWIIKSGLPEEVKDEVSNFLLAMQNNEPGRKRLKALGLDGFMPFDEKALTGIGKWLGL